MGLFSFDSLRNFVTGLGTAADKTTAAIYAVGQLDRAQLEAAYRSDWMARKIVDIPAEDCTREWRSWQATEDQITALEAEEKRLGVQRKTMLALSRSRLYGGAGIIIGGPGLPDQELTPQMVSKGGLRYLHVATRDELNAAEVNTNILDPFFGEPVRYNVSGGTTGSVVLHPSRVVRFVGVEAPSSQAKEVWGDSVLQSVDDAVKAAGTTLSSISALVYEAKLDIIRVPNLMQNMADETWKSQLQERFRLANFIKSLLSVTLLDKEEEWQRQNVTFTGLSDLAMLFLQVVCGAADIPATRMLGQAPGGLNASGDSDTRNYYDRLASEQETVIRPALEKLDEFLIHSALGSRPPEVHYWWDPLWQMDAAQKAEVNLKNAQAFEVDARTGLIDDYALGRGRENQLIEDGVYPGFEGALQEAEELDLEAEEVEPDPAPADPAAPPAGDEPVTVVGTRTPDGALRFKVSDVTAALIRKARGRRTSAAQEVFEDHKRRVRDARPRSLYVRRQVLNAREIVAWAKSQGFETTLPPEDMHVTIAFSREPVDWMKVGQAHPMYSTEDGRMTIEPGGPRLVERLGGRAVVLMFASSQLGWRHHDIRDCGASWDWPEYQPHVTLTYAPGDVNLEEVEPYRGRIVLGPEIFEEVDEGWKEGVTEVAT